jgi:uncharacterized membrane protein YeiH
MEFISIVEMIGTVAFAVSGALTAIEKKLDYYGIIVFAIITSVGGGIVRDVLIDRALPSALNNPIYMLISIAAAVLVIAFYNRFIRLSKVLQLFDAIGLGAFTAIGAEVAIANGLHQPFVIITLAVLTGTGGGVIRDVFAKRVPFVFREEVYAVASVLGAVIFMGIYKLAGNETAVYACFAITFSIRLLCMKMNIHLNKVDKLYKVYKAA